jgi:hypothetical protein
MNNFPEIHARIPIQFRLKFKCQFPEILILVLPSIALWVSGWHDIDGGSQGLHYRSILPYNHAVRACVGEREKKKSKWVFSMIERSDEKV